MLCDEVRGEDVRIIMKARRHLGRMLMGMGTGRRERADRVERARRWSGWEANWRRLFVYNRVSPIHPASRSRSLDLPSTLNATIASVLGQVKAAPAVASSASCYSCSSSPSSALLSCAVSFSHRYGPQLRRETRCWMHTRPALLWWPIVRLRILLYAARVPIRCP